MKLTVISSVVYISPFFVNEYTSNKTNKTIRAVEIHTDNLDQLNKIINSSITPNLTPAPASIGIAPDHYEDCEIYLYHTFKPKDRIPFEIGNMLIQDNKGNLSWMTKKDFEKEYGKVKNPRTISKHI